MTGAATSTDREALSRAYASGLLDYISGAGEVALKIAYELGRKAVNQGVGVLEMALIHHQALGEILLRGPMHGEEALTLAAQFFGEAVSTFEMTVRSYQANARLLGLSEVLARQNSESNRAHDQLRTILDATTAIIYLKDAQGRYLFINRQFQDAFRLKRERVIGKKDEEVLPKTVADVLWANDSHALAGRVPRELEEILDLGESLHTYISLKFPLLSGSGDSYAICCVATDITERKQADEALRRAKEATEAANSELEAFAYSVSHDLRAPLRHISGFAQILTQQAAGKLDFGERELLERIVSGARSMSILIDELLRFSRLSRVELTGDDIDLDRLAEDVIKELELETAQRRVVWKRGKLPTVRGDRTLLQQVFMNLVSNALKYTRPRNPAEIEFGSHDDPDSAVLFVRDNGVGFDPRYADKLFGVFQRLHREEEFEGTGIGLANVRRIILRHGGKVWADAVPGGGATFYFSFPRSRIVGAHDPESAL